MEADDHFSRVLKWYKSDIIRCVNLSYLFQHLRKYNVITAEEEQELQTEKRKESKKSASCAANKMFRGILKTKGSIVFAEFLKALGDEKKHMGHKHLYNLFALEYDLSRRRGYVSPSERHTEPIGFQSEHFEMSTRRDYIKVGHDSTAVTSAATGVNTNGQICGCICERRLEQVLDRLCTMEDKFDRMMSQNNAATPLSQPPTDYHYGSQTSETTTVVTGFPLPPLQSVELSNVLNDSHTESPLDVQHLPRTLSFAEVVCPCKSLQFLPFVVNYKAYFVYQMSTENESQGVSENFNFLSGEWEEKTFVANSNRNACSTMLIYSEKLTVFGGDSEKLGLYSLDKNLWEFIESSEFPFHNLDLNNSACVRYFFEGHDGIVLITKCHTHLFIYLFSLSKVAGSNWKSAKLSPSHLENGHCQIQSCFAYANNIYLSLLSSTHLFVYQVDLIPLQQSTMQTCSLLLKSSWCLDNYTIKKCYLSCLNEEVVTIMIKEIKEKKVVELSSLSHFNSGSLNPLTSFSSVVEVVTATIVPDSINMAIVYCESEEYKLCVLNVDSSSLKTTNGTEVEVTSAFAVLSKKLVHILNKTNFSEIKKVCLDNINTSLGPSIPYNVEKKIEASKDFDSLLNILSPAYCNWLNIYFLKKMAKKASVILETKEATELIAKFTEDIFSKKLKDVFHQIPPCHAGKDYIEIEEIWDKDFSGISVEDLVVHWKHIAKKLFYIEQCTLVLHKVVASGVKIHWFIPTTRKNHVLQAVHRATDFKTFGITYLKIDSDVFQQDSDSCDSTVTPVAPESDFCEPKSATTPSGAPKEFTVFQQYYASMTSSITDIDGILKHCVTKSIIAFNEEQKIKSKATALEKVECLLGHIYGPLRAGWTDSFTILLEIMETYGQLTTQQLAQDMKKALAAM